MHNYNVLRMNETDRATYLHPRKKRLKLSNKAKFRDFEIKELMDNFEQPDDEMDLSELLTKAELSALDKTGNLRLRGTFPNKLSQSFLDFTRQNISNLK